MSKHKIIHLLPSNNFSGAENVALQIIDLFKDDDVFEMYYVCTDGPIRSVLEQRKVKYEMLSKFSYNEIKEVINRIQPDIIHAHDFRASVLASFFSKKAKIISHLHANWPWIKKINIKTIAYALALKKINLVLGVSQSIYDEYIFNKCLRNKFFVLPNVLNSENIQKKSEEFKIDPIDLLFVGRLIDEKNPLLFLEIINVITKKGYSIDATMLGDGHLKQSCQNYIIKNNLTKNVTLKGFVSNPYPYMKAAKILVMPSKYEGFGLVAIESMLLDTVVIGTAVGGLQNILNNTCSLIVTTKEEFVLEIENLLKNKDLCHKKAEISKSKIETYTDLNAYKKTLSYYYKKF